MKFITLSTVVLLVPAVAAGPIAYGLCQTGQSTLLLSPRANIHHHPACCAGCNAVVMACYAAAGATFGTIAAPAAPAAIVGCNAALGTCSATCATVALLAPTP
jgi:hypothetical protein